MMDSKVVSRGIKDYVWPMLKEGGFDDFSTRTAWRHHPDRIDVVNFQSFNTYNAAVIGCTTYSFAVNLGCYILGIPSPYGPGFMKEKKGRFLPVEAQCHFRGPLHPSISQPELLATDIWFIDEKGKNLAASLTDVVARLEDRGLKWFAQFQHSPDVLRILSEEPEQMSELWGFGRNPSPIRHYLTGYVALRLGEQRLAAEHLESALASGCFSAVSEQLAADIHAAQPPVAASGSHL
jgi:hypothetical protein